MLQMNVLCGKYGTFHVHWPHSVYEAYSWACVTCSSIDKERRDLVELPWHSELIFIYIQGHDYWDVLCNAMHNWNLTGRTHYCQVWLHYMLWVSPFVPTHCINSLNAELNTICRLLALVGAHYILHVSRVRVNVIFARGKYSRNVMELFLVIFCFKRER